MPRTYQHPQIEGLPDMEPSLAVPVDLQSLYSRASALSEEIIQDLGPIEAEEIRAKIFEAKLALSEAAEMYERKVNG